MFKSSSKRSVLDNEKVGRAQTHKTWEYVSDGVAENFQTENLPAHNYSTVVLMDFPMPCWTLKDSHWFCHKTLHHIGDTDSDVRASHCFPIHSQARLFLLEEGSSGMQMAQTTSCGI